MKGGTQSFGVVLEVSKYASTTLALNELGRYPIQIRRTVESISCPVLPG